MQPTLMGSGSRSMLGFRQMGFFRRLVLESATDLVLALRLCGVGRFGFNFGLHICNFLRKILSSKEVMKRYKIRMRNSLT